MTVQPTMSRRTLAKGVAWAAPAVLAAGVAPAYAASQTCRNVNATFVGAAALHWGTVGAGRTRQQLQLFGRMQITGVARDSVQSVKAEYVVQQRADNTSQPGAPVPTANGTDWKGTYTASGSQLGLTNKGATAVVSNPATGTTSYFPPSAPAGQAAPIREYDPNSTDGTRYTTYTIAADLTNFSSAYYSPDGSGDTCGYTFDTGTGNIYDFYALNKPIEINWQNQQALTAQNYQRAQTDGLHVVVRYTITMKNGTVYPTQEFQLPVQPGMQHGYFKSDFGKY